MKRTVQERFWSKVDKSGECWLWTGARNTSGYGSFVLDRRVQCAHRVAWDMLVGELPSGATQLDHICHVKNCVNPAHLRPVTQKQNRENLIGAYRNSSTRERGVFERNGRYRVMVRHNGILHHFGTYDTIEEARAVARAKRQELFDFSAN